jgi:anti-sigma B factor antagonist
MSQSDESLGAPQPAELVDGHVADPSPDPTPAATVVIAPDRSRVVLTGEIDLAASGDLDQAAKAATESERQVEVDLSEVTFMDSIGIGFIAKLIIAGRGHGWRPRLVGAQQQVLETLTISGVADSVDLADPAS